MPFPSLATERRALARPCAGPPAGEVACLCGIITDRDIVTKCIARGADPARVTAGELAQGMPVTIESVADVADVLRAMEQHQIHRLPVIESQQPVGMISQADLARQLPESAVGQFIEAVCASK
jgi:signal-transduction protein with cAMP-binding, CBS, and nucleotidyltransferase domain